MNPVNLIVIPQVSLPDQMVRCQEAMADLAKVQKGLNQLQQETAAREINIQARIQTALNHAQENLDYEYLEQEAALLACQAGYPEITLPRHEGWKTGFPKHEDPRPFKWARFLTPLFITEAMTALLLLGMLAVFAKRDVPLPSISLPLAITFVVLVFGTFGAEPRLAQKNTESLRKHGFPYDASFLKSELPSALMGAYKKAEASDLFDHHIRVFAPKEAFHRRVEDMPMIIFGKVNNHTFLIAQNPRGLQAGRRILFWQLHRKTF
ncbi:MAG TPA: hypothetical protein VJC15_03190 [Candidatus Paceibacterota bacterium]